MKMVQYLNPKRKIKLIKMCRFRLKIGTYARNITIQSSQFQASLKNENLSIINPFANILSKTSIEYIKVNAYLYLKK